MQLGWHFRIHDVLGIILLVYLLFVCQHDKATRRLSIFVLLLENTYI